MNEALRLTSSQMYLNELEIQILIRSLKLTLSKDFVDKVDFSLRKQLSGLHFQEVRFGHFRKRFLNLIINFLVTMKRDYLQTISIYPVIWTQKIIFLDAVLKLSKMAGLPENGVRILSKLYS